MIERLYNTVKYFYPDLQLNSILATYYPTDLSQLPFHSDDESQINPNSQIITLSLGSSRKIAFRHARNCRVLAEVCLVHGDVMIFSRASQDLFEHSIIPCTEPKRHDNVNYRISLTFRSLR